MEFGRQMIRIPVAPAGFVELPEQFVDFKCATLSDAPGRHRFEMNGTLLDASRGLYSCGGMLVHAPGASVAEKTFYVSVSNNKR